jgi:Tfp pilus assembly protein PilN
VRPVNLVPPEERRGERSPARTGPAVYGFVGLLAVGVIAVTMVVMTNNDISESNAQIADLEAQEQAATAEANRLAAFAEFATVQEAREATVSTLARSRFDWERVLNELALIIPSNVWLTDVTATVAPAVALSGGADSDLRSGIAGPALSLVGCGVSHEAVAEFAAALEDIDGVTRVGVSGSALAGASGGSAGGTDCRTRDFIASFTMVAAFDAVQVDTATNLPVPPVEPLPADDGGVAEVNAKEQEARDSIDSQTDKAKDDVAVISGTVR